MFKKFLGLVQLLILCVPLWCLAAAELSPEEQFWYETINSMSEEEQIQLWNVIVDEVQKEAEKLPEAEREQFLKDFWNEVNSEAVKLEEKLQSTPVQQPEPVSKPVEQPKPAEPVKQPQELEQSKRIMQLIDSLILSLERYSKKAGTLADLAVRFKDWTDKKEINNLPAGTTLVSFNKDLEDLRLALYQLKERDPKTNDFKHVSSLVKNEGLINNLSQLHAVLSQQEPLFVVSTQGIEKLSSSSKLAIQKIIQALGEALYRNTVTAGIKTVMAPYDQRSKELQSMREADIKAAEAAQTKPSAVRPVASAGQKPEPLAGKPSSQRAASRYDYDDEDDYWEPSYRSYDNQPSYQPSSAGSSKFGGDRAGGGASGTPVAGEPFKGAKQDDKKGADKDDKDKKDVKEKADDSLKTLDKRLDDIQVAIEDLLIALELNFEKIATQLLDAKVVDESTASKILPDLVAQAIKCVEKVRALTVAMGTKKLTDEQKKKYRNALSESLEFAEGRFISVRNKIDELKAKESSFALDKQYAYFGGKAEPTNQALKKSVPNPGSLDELSSKLKELSKRIKEL